jgi:GNAT superfamily N-acetyltransferase
MTITVSIERDGAKLRALLEALTARLPEWFGCEDSNRDYAEQALTLPGWMAAVDGRACGLLLLKRHGVASAEIYWMAVDPAWHGRGIGRALVEAAAQALMAEHRKLLVVCTLGPENPNEHYRRTRLFYERLGFFYATAEHGAAADGMAYFAKLLAPS